MNLKKTAIALAIASVTVVPMVAQADAGAYGRLDVSMNVKDNGDDTILDVFGTNSRFGFKGSEDMGNGMEAFYRYEFRVFADKADIAHNNRLSFVGIGGDFGKLSLGQQWSGYYNNVGTISDPTYTTGTGSITPYRISDTIKYAGNFGAFNFAIDLGFDGSEGSASSSVIHPGTGVTTKTDVVTDGEDLDRMGIAGTFSLDALTLAAALDSKIGHDSVTTTTVGTGAPTVGAKVSGDDVDTIGFAVKYAINDMLWLSGVLETQDDGSSDDLTYTQFGVGYSNFFAHFGLKEDDDTGTDDSIIQATYTHKLSPRTRLYGEYIATSPDVGEDTSDIYLALRHDF